jgi:hypothetical protein
MKYFKISVVSPYDKNSKIYKCKNNHYKCKNTGTLFENIKIEFQKWFVAIFLITSRPKGTSAHQLVKDLKMTHKTAWFMLHRIRKCFKTKKIRLKGNIKMTEMQNRKTLTLNEVLNLDRRPTLQEMVI